MLDDFVDKDVLVLLFLEANLQNIKFGHILLMTNSQLNGSQVSNIIELYCSGLLGRVLFCLGRTSATLGRLRMHRMGHSQGVGQMSDAIKGQSVGGQKCRTPVAGTGSGYVVQVRAHSQETGLRNLGLDK